MRSTKRIGQVQTLLMLFLFSCALSVSAAPETPIVLWPAGAPGAVGNAPTDIPTLTPYLAPKDKATGAAIIVCPGGGYQHLADHEGGPVAEWLNSIGVTAFVLKYRLGPTYHHPAPAAGRRPSNSHRARASEGMGTGSAAHRHPGILGGRASRRYRRDALRCRQNRRVRSHRASQFPTRLDDPDLSGDHNARFDSWRLQKELARGATVAGTRGAAF